MNKKAKITICDVYDARRSEKRYIIRVDGKEKINTSSISEFANFLIGFTESAGSVIVQNINHRER